jgi:hypothetical protein
MPVPVNLTDLSVDPLVNSPPGTESAKGNIDNYLRQGFAFTRQAYNNLAGATQTIASAATTTIGGVPATWSSNMTITGTTTITAFDTVADGIIRNVTFAGALTLTHNATSLILPTGANITTVAGDCAVLKSLGGGNWRCLSYQGAGLPTTVDTGPMGGNRNRIINGNFAINQRAVSGTVALAAGAYGHDRFKAGAGGCTYTFATSGADTILTISAGSLIQVIEGANIEGGIYTLSQAGTAQARIGINGASSAAAYAALPLASASAAGGQNITIEFTTGTASKAQLEAGSVATPFERRSYGLELSLCQRYYWQREAITQSYPSTGLAGGSASLIPFPQPMRSVPSMSTNLTDANFVTSGSPVGAQWGLIVYGVGSATKTGTILFSFIPTTLCASLATYGPTYSIATNTLIVGPGITISASSEL